MVNAGSVSNEILRLRSAIAVILAAFAALVAVSAGAMWKWSDVTDVVAVVGVIDGVVGVIVGSYVGSVLACANLEHAEQARRDAEEARARAEMRALRLAASTDPVRAESLLARADL